MAGKWFRRKARNTHYSNKKHNIRFFSLETLKLATNNFSTLLGRGGYGTVYKGILPDEGTTIAVKKFSKSYDGFLEMVDLMSHIRHKNIIQVIGCCVDNNQQLLVCEFADKDMWHCLYGANNALPLDWKTRASVCIGTARGLSYLHHDIHPRIIHRDIKPSNILLDANFVPKIVDFDLICYADGGGKQTDLCVPNLGVEYFCTYTTSYAKGTLGYLDPTYLCTGEINEKVDIYSFGLVMLEIIAGRPPVNSFHLHNDGALLDWVTRLKKDGQILKIVDPKLTDFPEDDVERFINIALLCTRSTQQNRPSMYEVVHMLCGGCKSDTHISDMAATAVAENAAYAADMEAGEETTVGGYSDSFIVLSNREGECSGSQDLVREYYERSMEKITRHQVAKGRRSVIREARTMGVNNSSANMFSEAVYPPFLSGEYRSARVLYSRRPAPL